MRSMLVVFLFLCAPLPAQQTTSGSVPGAQAWYLPATDATAELFIFEIGAGEPVVVLHGGPGADFTYMLPIANGLLDKARFVFYDQRGSLRSRALADSISMAKHVIDLETLRAALGVDRISILSHSAGTLLAFEYLRAHPERVKNVVLTGALPHKNGRAYFDAEYADLWKSLAEDSKAFQERPALLRELRKIEADPSITTPKREALLANIRQIGGEMFHVERWRERLPVRVRPDAARATRATTNFEYNYGTNLARHTFPVTVINGEFDYTVGPRGSPLWQRFAKTEASGVEVVIIPNASHNVWYDDPVRFREALRQALRQ